MELSWSTFLLEIVNFVVLVWILKRFLYRPVLAVIARRRAGIDRELADAAALKTEAEALRTRYEGRVEEWNAERQKAREALNQELDAERAKRLEALRGALERERTQAAAAEARRQADTAERVERTALEQAARFAARLLEHAAGPETERRLAELALEQLAALPAAQAAEIADGLAAARAPEAPTLAVASAYPLDQTLRDRLATALAALLGRAPHCEFVEDPSLVAGLRVTVGPWVLGLNVRDELAGFARFAHER